MTCGLFVGMVLGLQGYDLLQRFGSEDALGTAAALALVKELGPVVTALLFAGRAGTALASEIGLMRATDQLTAMEMMAVDPMRRVVAPRFLGGMIAMPLLTVIFIAIGIFGVQLVGVQQFGVDAASFWSQMRSSVGLDDIMEGVIKGCVFGVACSLIAVYEGYNADADRRRRRARDDTHRGHLGGADTDSGLHAHRDHAVTAELGTSMRPTRTVEISTGLFVLLGFAALFFLVTQITNRELSVNGNSYEVTAQFENIGSLKPGAAVSMAGVTVGRVESIGSTSRCTRPWCACASTRSSTASRRTATRAS